MVISMKIQTGIQVKSYKADGFIGRYQRLIRETVIPYQYDILCDNIPGAEKSHVVQNFINAGKAVRGEDVGDGFYGMVFQDSDAAKWIEAAAYSLAANPDPELEKTVDGLIELIAAAQDEDGYLNTYFTVKDREKRWQNLMEGHELYCAGHIAEAACAYYEATGKTALLDVMLKNAEHIYKRFVTDKAEGYPGHPEIELALMKLYRVTKNEHCLKLAEHFISVRGADPHFYEKEAQKRDWTVWGNNPSDYNYMQSAKPVREQSDATGHAVRAVYLYTGMADLAGETGDSGLFAACRRLWESITRRRMYVTGGIGSTVIGEAFSVDYDLPPDTAYAETCASVGLMFFAEKMLENEINGEYADIMERAFYNTVLSGMQLDGKRFFYVNPLECIPGISGVSPTAWHDLPERPKWYACACCPPNVARLIASFGKYAYGESGDTAYCHLYAAGTVSFKNGITLKCDTNYPYEFDIKYAVSGEGRLAVRIPAYSRKYTLTVNGKAVLAEPVNGYAYLDVSDGDTVQLTLDGTPYFVYPSAKIPAVSGMAALMRGPLVYCFEGVDNEDSVTSLSLLTSHTPAVCEYDSSLLCGTAKIIVNAVRNEDFDELYSSTRPTRTPTNATAVPYYTWANRGVGEMRVWMNIAD